MAYRPRMLVFRSTVVVAAIVSSSTLAAAETLDEPGVTKEWVAHDVAADSAFTPSVFRASGKGRALIVAAATYNSAADNTSIDLSGEAQVWGPFRLVLSVTNMIDNARPGIGGAIQFLDETKHGVAGSGYLQYKPEGFTEPEGEIEALFSFSKQLGAVRGTLNLAYGQDPEAVERDGEIALAAHIEPMRGLFAGVIARYRDALGSNGDKGTGVLRDLIAGPTGTYVVNRVGISLTAGVAAVETLASKSMTAGAMGTLSIGTVF